MYCSPFHTIDAAVLCLYGSIVMSHCLYLLTASLFVVAPPLSMDSVMTVLEGVAGRWRGVGRWLSIPGHILIVISEEGGSDMERLRAVVRYWLLRDPQASWRKLIWQLDYDVDDPDLHAVADSIRNYAEKLTGQ